MRLQPMKTNESLTVSEPVSAGCADGVVCVWPKDGPPHTEKSTRGSTAKSTQALCARWNIRSSFHFMRKVIDRPLICATVIFLFAGRCGPSVETSCHTDKSRYACPQGIMNIH